jgi:HD-GYP domain-containing protein (c-di-GMP phosphodiesterase class II)
VNRSNYSVKRSLEAIFWLALTMAIAGIVVVDGHMPSIVSTGFFVPIAFAGYRYHLSFSVFLAAVASVFTSPAMSGIGVEINDSVMPSLWLAWPAFYLFIAVMANQWASILKQRHVLDESERSVNELNERNIRRERELETLSAIHTAIMSGNDEPMVVEEITKRVAATCDTKFATITLPIGTQRQRPLLPVGFSEEVFRKFFPQGAPFGEGVDGWAMLHRKIASAKNIFEDPRYDKMRDLAALVGFVSAAAAPFQLEDDIYAALMICYPEEHEFSGEELTRLERLAQQTEIAIRSVRQRESLSRFAFDTAIALTEAIESRDPYTGGHCRRLAEYAALTAKELHMPNKEVESIRLGAALHDMGKIVVPDSILKKPDKLTPEEYAIVKQHCYSGGQICKRVGFLKAAYPIVYHHHERWDGRGYPDGVAGERIPLGARIVAVMDAYDAMTTDRPYRGAMSFAEATAILKDGGGTQWDPHIVDIFLQMLMSRPELQSEEAYHRSGDGLILPQHAQTQRPGEIRETIHNL